MDIALAPLGLKTGGMIRTGKNIQKGRVLLQNSLSDFQPDFFKTMVNGLEEEDYLKVVQEISQLPLNKQQELAAQLANLSSKNDVERLAMIRALLDKQGVSIPSAKQLRNRRFERVSSNPTVMKELKDEFKDVYDEFGIQPGGGDEQVFLTMAGIIKGEGCTGFCLRSKLSKNEVVVSLRQNLTSCQK